MATNNLLNAKVESGEVVYTKVNFLLMKLFLNFFILRTMSI